MYNNKIKEAISRASREHPLEAVAKGRKEWRKVRNTRPHGNTYQLPDPVLWIMVLEGND